MRKITPSYIRKMQYYANLYNKSNGSNIWTAYDRPSDRKVNAYKALRDIALNSDCRVLGHNCMQFTTGMYRFSDETGELVFRVDTRDNVYEIPANYVKKSTIYELVLIWADGDKNIFTYSSEDEAKQAEENMLRAHGNQISWTGIRRQL